MRKQFCMMIATSLLLNTPSVFCPAEKADEFARLEAQFRELPMDATFRLEVPEFLVDGENEIEIKSYAPNHVTLGVYPCYMP